MKFIQPVSMPCTKEQYEEFLKEPLLRMGYKEESTFRWGSVDCQFVATNYDDVPSFCGNITKESRSYKRRFYIETFNPELFLAIAAMTDEEYGIPGEYWTYRGTSNQDWTHGEVYKSAHKVSEGQFAVNDKGVLDGYRTNNREAFRKSTLEELVEQLIKQENSRQEMEIVKVTREDLSKVWKVACDAWKLKIEGYATKYGSPLSSELEIPNNIVSEMFREANTRQEAVLKEVFPHFKEDKNAWKQLNDFELTDAIAACNTLGKTIGLGSNLQILGNPAAEGMDKPELGGRALWVHGSIDVVLHLQGKNTIIEFRRR